MTRKYAPYLKGTQRASVAHDLAIEYLKGSTIRSVAERAGRSYGAVRKLLLEAGVELRTPGGHARKKAD
ncbi:helix-turn-helix domain-containing protein [Streptomyces lasiicapitis]|uniref:helix-turn-helix domain-containing protein n=1 Tax=Streptomyces lasiicapitis TaxID=1923961 RepID=UPI0036539456